MAMASCVVATLQFGTAVGTLMTAASSRRPSRLQGMRQGLPSVFGVDNVDITLAGTNTDAAAQATGSAAQAPGVSFSVALSRLSD